jgi:hypothetical protein
MEVLGDKDEDPVLREEEQETPALYKPAVMVDMGAISKVSNCFFCYLFHLTDCYNIASKNYSSCSL